MAHFAKLDENNIVMRVEVVENSVLLDSSGTEQEQLGIDFLRSIYGLETNWAQTSYNNTFRNKFAGMGDYYNRDYNVFVAPKPYPSWLFNSTEYVWYPPKPIPESTNNEIYNWNEQLLDWEIVGYAEPESTQE